MAPIEVLRLWFDAHARGDLHAARDLLVDGAEVVVGGTSLHGFDSFMQWYRQRAGEEGPSFRYSVQDLLGGESHAAAVLSLHAEGRTWRQVALYQVDGDRISSVWAVEDAR